MLLSLLSVPIGFITCWSGFIAGIPPHWTLCDGSEGTPDLRDSFVVGAQNTYIPGATGGTITHVHDFTGNGHLHILELAVRLAFPGPDYHGLTTTDPSAGTTNLTGRAPPWYSLAYVMYTGREN